MLHLANSAPMFLVLMLVGVATCATTLAGGALALRVRRHIRFILGFSAGAVIAVALFDLLPEALALGGTARPARDVVTFVAIGFAAYMLLDRTLQALNSGGELKGHLGPASLTVHSFLDGLGIGLAAHVSISTGVVLALAVLAHDFSDGVNTVNLSLSGGGDPRGARRWLVMDAAAPIAGIVAGQSLTISSSELGLVLALFAGVFLYIGASELLPDSHHRLPRAWTSVATLLGMSVIYAAVRLAGS